MLIAEGTVADFVFSSLSTLSLTGVEDLLSGPPGGGVSGSSVKLLRFIFLFFLSKKVQDLYCNKFNLDTICVQSSRLDCYKNLLAV